MSEHLICGSVEERRGVPFHAYQRIKHLFAVKYPACEVYRMLANAHDESKATAFLIYVRGKKINKVTLALMKAYAAGISDALDN